MNRRSFILVWLLMVSSPAWAHDPGLSGAIGRLQENRLELTISFAIRDAGYLAPLDANNDGVVTSNEFALGKRQLAETVAGHCEVKINGSPVEPEIASCQQDDARNVSIRLDFPAPRTGLLQLDFPVIELLPFGHRMFLSLSDTAGKTLVERLLSANAATVSVKYDTSAAAPPEGTTHTFTDFVLMGLEHIGTGYDHLLFLWALLVVTRSFRSALGVITAFTIAHSITLAIATFNLVKISPGAVESLIAATIVYVGVENLVRHGNPRNRLVLAFCFGLIHGFGFAAVLRGMGVGERAGGVVLPLFGFNLGVELAQLGFIIALLPLFVWLTEWKHGAKLKNALSFAICLLGLEWFSASAFNLRIPGLN